VGNYLPVETVLYPKDLDLQQTQLSEFKTSKHSASICERVYVLAETDRRTNEYKWQ
jgi:hypothetical protein